LNLFFRDDTFLQKGNRKYLNQDNVDLMRPIKVTKVPPTPNGPIKYEVQYNEKDPLMHVADKWNWDRAQPCKRKGFCKGGRRTLQICRGSMECSNTKCPYRKIYQFPNRVDFTRSKTCMHCKVEPSHVNCSARKYVENDRCHKKLMVIYVGEHLCTPKANEAKPKKEEVENLLRTRPTITTGQMQIDKVREALLGDNNAQEIQDVAMQYSNKRHLQFLHTSINKKMRPGGSDIEAIRLMKDDFVKRGLDENLIMDIGEDSVILSSKQKLHLAALITIGQVTEPVSLDGCESHAKDYTEVEMTTYYPVLRRNVKLVSMFVPKPGENSENVAEMIRTFDAAVNEILPSVAREHGLNPDDFAGRGLDPHSYVGDEGGALWSGLCKAKGNDVKNKTVSDLFHIKQDIRRHLKYFKTDKDGHKFEQLMSDAYNATTSIHADEAEKALENLIIKRSTNVKKMNNFKIWWWRRRARWQKWCRTFSTSSASSAEVANSKSISASGYRKRLLDVVTTECSAAILEAAEIKRQVLGLRTVGRGPTAADREENLENEMFLDKEACVSAVEHIHEKANSMTDSLDSLTNIESAQKDYRVNVRDSHRADKRKKQSRNEKKQKEKDTRSVNKKQLKYFNKNVNDITMDVLECESGMTQFTFKILDTMGYLETVVLSKDSFRCSSPACKKNCHHLVWVFHNVFNFPKHEPLIYQKKCTLAEWQKIVESFPEKVPLSRLPKVRDQRYTVTVRDTKRDAKCAVCKKNLTYGDIQACMDGAYRTIHRAWIVRTFFFCPSINCITKMPRNSYVIPFCPSTMTLNFDSCLTLEQTRSIELPR